MASGKKSARVANALRQLIETGTVAGYAPPEEESAETRMHKADEPGVIWVEIDRIEPSRFQHDEQIHPDEFAALLSSIQTEGLWQAFNVMEDSKRKGYYILTSGMHQRLKAAKQAGHTRVPIFVGPPLDPRRLAFRAAKENTTRVNTSMVNLGHLFIQMGEELGVSQEEIAAELRKSREFVKFAVMAARSAPDIQAMIHQKPDSIRAMTYLRRIKPESEHSTQEELDEAAALRAPIIERFLRGDLSTDGLRAEVETVLAQRAAKSQQPQGEEVAAPEMASPMPQEPPSTVSAHPIKDIEPHDVQGQSAAKIHEEPDERVAQQEVHPHLMVVSSAPTEAKPKVSQPPDAHISERIGQAQAVLSRFQTYKRLVGSDVLTEQERRIVGAIGAMVEQLLEGE